ncbi:class I SAM-dependent methyltransferase, partial [bacterium]|nr:class I SAM-dependent methyltransferase [Candidatus Elulimicrobium humile]
KNSDGIGIDINEEHVNKFKKMGYNGIVGNATELPFEDKSFELTIFNHVIEHLPNQELGMKALDECLRVSSKYVFLALPFFDEDEYLNSLGLKTFYSHWVGHTNIYLIISFIESHCPTCIFIKRSHLRIGTCYFSSMRI